MYDFTRHRVYPLYVTYFTHSNKKRPVCNVNILQNLIYSGSRFRAYARMEVIVSAGAVMSPQLLMLSGLGPKAHLKKHGASFFIKLTNSMRII